MKKKIFAAMCAAILGCCASAGTASAAENAPVDYSKYQLGDITMDGIVGIEDAQLALQTYVFEMACVDSGIPYEQQLLGCVKGFTIIESREYPAENKKTEKNQVINALDAQVILMYYVDALAKQTDLSFEAWVNSNAHLQQVFADDYEIASRNTKQPVYTTDPETGESVIAYYLYVYPQKVRD